MPITSTTEISRAKLAHPDFDHQGGSALHTKVATLLTRLGDFIDSRFFYQNALANSSSVDFDHNFKTALYDLVAVLYLRDTGTGELTRITPTSTPAISSFTIAATPSFTTTKIRVTNNSGSARDIALVLRSSPPMIDDIYDVDLSTPPTNGQVLSYDSGTKTWKPASGANLSTNALSGLLAAIDFEQFTSVQTTGFTAARGQKVLADTTSGAFTIVFPSAVTGDKIEVWDYSGKFGVNPITINPGGNLINGVAGTRTLTMSWSRTKFVFAAGGWMAIQTQLPKQFTDVKISSYTAIPGQRVLTNSTSGAFNITLPTSPTFGTEIEIIDAYGTWALNNVTVLRNGSNINSVASDMILNVNGGRILAIYIDSTQGWRID